MKEYLKNGLLKLEINLEETVIEKLAFYIEFLKKENEIVNLTAIKDDKEIVEKHFIDSLMILKYLPENINSAIDIGTGAGFPGMVLAIANEDINFTLVDSIGKKTHFLEKLKEKLKIDNVEIITGRAEDIIKNRREMYDIGLSRAVGEVNLISEYVIPFLKEGGIFLVQKVNYEEELKKASNCLKILKSDVVSINENKLPYSEERRVIITIRKKEKTEEKYPRRAGIPLKRPL